MKTLVGTLFLMAAVVLGSLDVEAMNGGGGGRNRGFAASSEDTTTRNASVPEPSTLYAVGAGLALLGGAGWYIRRRK